MRRRTLAAADVVAVPSLWESGPLVVAEALLLGRPVVSTPVGFVPELIDDGRAGGLLVPIGDAEAMASALTRVLADPEEGRRLGEQGRSRVGEQLDPDRLVDAVVARYEAAGARR